MTISIDLRALTAWETGAPLDDPNTDAAFDPDEAIGNICPGCNGTGLEIIYHSAAVSWETGEPLDFEETHCRTCGGGGYLTEPADDPGIPPLPAPWRMSIEALDSWNDFYRTRLRGLGRGCGALTAEETTHRAEVEANINARHDARRHSAFPR